MQPWGEKWHWHCWGWSWACPGCTGDSSLPHQLPTHLSKFPFKIWEECKARWAQPDRWLHTRAAAHRWPNANFIVARQYFPFGFWVLCAFGKHLAATASMFTKRAELVKFRFVFGFSPSKLKLKLCQTFEAARRQFISNRKLKRGKEICQMYSMWNFRQFNLIHYTLKCLGLPYCFFTFTLHLIPSGILSALCTICHVL